jgi:hypothetical protein
LIFQALGRKLHQLPVALNAIFGSMGQATPEAAAARQTRANEIVASANAFLANPQPIQSVRDLVRSLHGYRAS